MLSVIITADKIVDNIYERDSDIVRMLRNYKIEHEIVYVCNEDYSDKQLITTLVQDKPEHSILVMAKDTNLSTLIYAGIARANGNEVLLLTVDTNKQLISDILEKRNDGYESIVVQKKQKGIVSLITSIGTGTYKFGQTCMGRAHDMCNDSNIALLTPENVNQITFDAELSKVYRITNQSGDKKHILMKRDTLYDHPTPQEQKPLKSLTSLGVASTLYYIALLCMAVVFPLFNNGIYAWWLIVGIVVWVALGVIGGVAVAKDNCNSRMKNGVPINLAGDPILNVVSYTAHGSESIYLADKDVDITPATQEEKPQENEEIATPTDTEEIVEEGIDTVEKSEVSTDIIESTTLPKKRGRPRIEKPISTEPKRPRGRPRIEKPVDVEPKRPRGRPRIEKPVSTELKRPRGRPRLQKDSEVNNENN